MANDTWLQREAAEYMACMEITQTERQELLDWIRDGRSVYDNPWYMADESGMLMDFISAMREVDDQSNAQ
jgi:hypothetical protein